MQPLYTAATQKQPGKSFKKIWEEEGLDVHFQKAKQLLVTACQLTHPDPNAPLALVADASGKAAGASLEQLTGGGLAPPWVLEPSFQGQPDGVDNVQEGDICRPAGPEALSR